MIIKRMLKEEWRMHSEMFSGRSFASFPVMIFLISSFTFWSVTEFSTLEVEVLSRGLIFLGAFFGLSVGSIGFSSKDAVKNVLGPTNFLVYSSRTLPVSSRKLLANFIVKDLVYYTVLFLVPVAFGALIFGGRGAVSGALGILPAFIAGLVLAVIMARLSVRIPGFKWSYGNKVSPLVNKTVLDVFRSTGGIIKIVFSLTVLTAFYWSIVLYFPFASAFLNNPSLSFSVLMGMVSLTVYNWINRFDSLEDYTYLPVDEQNLLKAKQKAFLAVSIPLTSFFILLSFLYYPPSLVIALLALVANISVQIYTAGIASYLTGLEPNTKLFDTKIFAKYLLLNSVFILPLLAFSVFFRPGMSLYFVASLIFATFFGIYFLRIGLRH